MYILSRTLIIQTNKSLSLAIKMHSHSFKLASFIASTIHSAWSHLLQWYAVARQVCRLCQECWKAEQAPAGSGRWGTTPNIPRRQLSSSSRAGQGRGLETHTVTCGQHQPEVLTNETRELSDHGIALQWNGSKIRPFQWSSRNDIYLCFS